MEVGSRRGGEEKKSNTGVRRIEAARTSEGSKEKGGKDRSSR